MKLLTIIYRTSVIILLCLNLLAFSFILRTNIEREAKVNSVNIELVELKEHLLAHTSSDLHMSVDTKNTVYAKKETLLAFQTAINERLDEIDPSIREQFQRVQQQAMVPPPLLLPPPQSVSEN